MVVLIRSEAHGIWTQIAKNCASLKWKKATHRTCENLKGFGPHVMNGAHAMKKPNIDFLFPSYEGTYDIDSVSMHLMSLYAFIVFSILICTRNIARSFVSELH